MASRKNRPAKKSSKPAVIEATATELKDDASAAPGAPVGTHVTSNADGHVTMEALGSGYDSAAAVAPDEPVSHEEREPAPSATTGPEASASASPKKSGGTGKWIAAGLAAALIAGIVGGGYLYHTYGQQMLGTGSAITDMAAIEAQVMDATGAAQSASQTADSVKAETASLATRLDQRTSELQQNLDAIRQSVDALRQSPQLAQAQPGGEELSALTQRLDGLASRIEQLEATAVAAPAPSSPADSAEVSALREQVASSEQRISSLTGQLETLSSELRSVNDKLAERPAVSTHAGTSEAISALITAVTTGAPYATELALLRERAALPALPVLDSNASTGIRTVAELDQQLQAAGNQLTARTSESAASSEGWWGALQSRISKVVTVRSLDNPDWPAVIAQARTALAAGGPGAAIASLPDTATGMPEVLSGWLVEARKHVAARSELEHLPQAALSPAPATDMAQ